MEMIFGVVGIERNYCVPKQNSSTNTLIDNPREFQLAVEFVFGTVLQTSFSGRN